MEAGQGQGRPITMLHLSANREKDYFKNQTLRKVSTLPKEETDNMGCWTSKQLNCHTWSRDVNTTELELKSWRLGQCMGFAFGWQIVLIFAFSLFVSCMDFENSLNYRFGIMIHFVSSVAETFYTSVMSGSGIMLMILASFQLFLLSTCLTPCGEKHAESIKEQIIMNATLQSFLKPLLYGTVAWAQCFIYVQLFDKDYENMFVMKETSGGLTNTYVLETPLIIRLATFFAGLEFFVTNSMSGGFRLQFASSRVRKCTLSYLIGIFQHLRSFWESVHVAFFIWTTCLVIGPIMYSWFFTAVGIKMAESSTLERIFMFLDIRFIYRIFLWVFLPQVTFQLYVNVLSSFFTEIVNFPVQRPSATVDSLTLSEGMMEDNIFLKYLAFYELNLKALPYNPDVMTFFDLTYPGNHPLNWNGVFTASCEVINEVNSNVISFLRSVQFPPTLPQYDGLQPYILTKLRRPSSPEIHIETYYGEGCHTRHMKNLVSNGYRGVSEEGPTVYDLAKQMPTALWNDLKDACKGLITSINKDLSSLLPFEKLERKRREKQVANSLRHATLSLWAMKGTMELMCISVQKDPFGIVHKDLQYFIENILETYDLMTVLDFYMANTFGRVDYVNEQVVHEIGITIKKLIRASLFVLVKLHYTFFHWNKVFNVNDQLLSRIEDIVSHS
ncbi:unnamed protein product [Orchesella dallaii]|uniref:Uncharacterized protein n=1 Tax=Orchesella dallaii TaxID=48710 RepID=A0ABP1QIU1_9HEXA